MQPKIYQLGEHAISPEQIDSHAFYVIQKLRQAGHTAYLVGGGVRDLLLGQRPKDYDVSTSAKPEEIKSLFRNAILIGRRFRLAHIRFGKKIIEVATFRSGATDEAGLIVRDNEWGTEEQDVLRRDFTINGLFYDPESQQVIDYVEGYPDLEKRVLRAIGQPEVRFTQDPVRMIRLIKFCARFDFEIHRPTFEALLNCKGEILKSSSARIFEELLRMLESGAAQPFFHLLNEYGLLKPLLPRLSEYLKEPKNKTYSLLKVIDDLVVKSDGEIDRSLLLSALIFPLYEERIFSHAQNEEKPPHLGQMSHIAYQTIDEVFSPFFQVPKRMRGIIGFLMSAQYRLIPLDQKPLRRLKPPKDPLFPTALALLKLRAKEDPALLPHYTQWTEASFSSHEPISPSFPDRKRRRRRRRRRKPPEPGESE